MSPRARPQQSAWRRTFAAAVLSGALTGCAALDGPLHFLGLAGGTEARCVTRGEVLVAVGDQHLACEAAGAALSWATTLAGRPLTEGQRRSVLESLRTAGETHGVEAVSLALSQAASQLDMWRGLSPQEAALARSRALHALGDGRGPFDAQRFPALVSAMDAAAAVWERTDDGLALSETDVEGWIRYASLCREVQGGSPLKVSVANRVAVYATLREVYREGTTGERQAVVQVGSVWPSVRLAWQMAPYEVQQAWIAHAPLPPPMTATSLGYFGALVEGAVVEHARVLHDKLGPLPMIIADVPGVLSGGEAPEDAEPTDAEL